VVEVATTDETTPQALVALALQDADGTRRSTRLGPGACSTLIRALMAAMSACGAPFRFSDGTVADEPPPPPMPAREWPWQFLPGVPRGKVSP
jgi:hypothetical protein